MDLIQIQLKSLAEEMQAINKGLEKVEQELTISENDGPVSEIFRKVTTTVVYFNLTICFNTCVPACYLAYKFFFSVILQPS